MSFRTHPICQDARRFTSFMLGENMRKTFVLLLSVVIISLSCASHNGVLFGGGADPGSQDPTHWSNSSSSWCRDSKNCINSKDLFYCFDCVESTNLYYCVETDNSNCCVFNVKLKRDDWIQFMNALVADGMRYRHPGTLGLTEWPWFRDHVPGLSRARYNTNVWKLRAELPKPKASVAGRR